MAKTKKRMKMPGAREEKDLAIVDQLQVALAADEATRVQRCVKAINEALSRERCAIVCELGWNGLADGSFVATAKPVVKAVRNANGSTPEA